MTFLKSHIMHFGLLITFSVLGGCDGSPRSLDSPDKTDVKLLDKYEVQTQDVHIVCRMCKKAVKKLMIVVIKQIDKEIRILCSKSKHSQNTCKQHAYKYMSLLIHWIFNGRNAKESCIHMHLCKKV
ncbi:hypothetical protein PGIGA_G00013410 [Pangasianodon gigas]|uniref:Uncharacterized protein n=1 Tax=Pangasianodon gigas TaxID=30993 RepID=A0ACC5WUF2_PANGG|nr:hypothetical protein [Pangasianodon gigas]